HLFWGRRKAVLLLKYLLFLLIFGELRRRVQRPVATAYARHDDRPPTPSRRGKCRMSFKCLVSVCRHPRFGGQSSDCLIERKDFLLGAAQAAERNGALLGLALADSDDQGHLGHRMLAHLVADLLGPQIELEA